MIKELEVIKEAIESKKGSDIVILDVGFYTSIADYFVICTGNSEPNVRAIVDEIDSESVKNGFSKIGIEGTGDAKWMLLDFGHIIVHVFNEETRKFYNLEQLWSHAEVVHRS